MSCPLISWDPVVSAGSLSAFAGVLAGLVFAGLIVLLSDRTSNPERIRAVTLLTGGLFALIIASLLFAVIAGDGICPRAWTLSIPTTSVLGVGTLAIFGGIASLIHAYDNDGNASRIANLGAYIIASLVIYYTQSLATQFDIILRLNEMIPAAPGWWLATRRNWTNASIIVIVLALVMRRITFSRKVTDAQSSTRSGLIGSDRLATLAAQLTVVYTGVAGALFGLILVVVRDPDWNRTSSGYIAVSPLVTTAGGYLAILVSTVAMVTQLLALPGIRTRARRQ